MMGTLISAILKVSFKTFNKELVLIEKRLSMVLLWTKRFLTLSPEGSIFSQNTKTTEKKYKLMF